MTDQHTPPAHNHSLIGYLALIDAASRLRGIGVPVRLDREHRNDLTALKASVNAKTRAIYLVNPHNPTGTVNEETTFKSFLREVSKQTPVIVDEAYLEYLPDFASRSAIDLVREGANVIVFRTFDKIHGLAGLPMGYAVVPRGLGSSRRLSTQIKLHHHITSSIQAVVLSPGNSTRYSCRGPKIAPDNRGNALIEPLLRKAFPRKRTDIRIPKAEG